ncbi:Hypothetical protein CINCED_3A016279 [Cinara cedri]|uniref:Uncharacterized protein n=1 Tax=Cinara cedri TaxID=506608 RepID=A0A5E4M1M4_9HEMI|nr:Hypothetical protein CINCED_3A016279 [Cinara cedri]
MGKEKKLSVSSTSISNAPPKSKPRVVTIKLPDSEKLYTPSKNRKNTEKPDQNAAKTGNLPVNKELKVKANNRFKL